MANLKCEYPCMLNVESNVIVARHIERETLILDTNFVVPESQVGGKITDIKHVMANVKEAKGIMNSVEISVDYQIIMTVAVGNMFHVVTIEDIFNELINPQDFDPPLTQQELRSLVQDVEVQAANWRFAYDIVGNSEDPSNPCNLTSPVVGTCIRLQVNSDISVVLDRMDDIVVFGEIA